jgi:FdhD protein
MIADEVPIAIEYNGIGYAVLMASAIDLVDLAHGFSFAERLALQRADIIDVDVHAVATGHVARHARP